MLAKVEFAAREGATTVLLQGGHNPALPMDYYLELVRETRRRFPSVTPHFFSASEIRTMSDVAGKPVPEVLALLKQAGQTSIPGGGAEVLSERVRTRIEPKKGGPGAWLEVHREAHRQGFKSTATMMYGHVEQPEDISTTRRDPRASRRARRLSPPSCPGPSSRAIPCSRSGSSIQGPERISGCSRSPGSTSTTSPTCRPRGSEGKRTGQVALSWGADDFGGTLFEENVHAAADYVNKTTVDEIMTLIRDAGFTPAQRTTDYEILKTY